MSKFEYESSPGIVKHRDNCHRLGFFAYAAFFQVIFLILFGLFARYNTNPDNHLDHYYPLFQDVHVMIFIGFGFLMTFLQKYGFSSVGYNFLIAAFTIQWSLFVNGFWHSAFYHGDEHNPTGYPFEPKCHEADYNSSLTTGQKQKFWCIEFDIQSLITSDFAAGAVLITFGAVLGKTNPLQLLVIATIETVLFGLNESIGALTFGAVDMGGSIFVHTFGAYFGLGVSYALSSAKNADGKIADRPNNSSIYSSDMFAMIGTLFLWMFWPSFNGALALHDQQHRVVINTVIALTGSCISAFAFDNLLRKGHKFDMVSIQNATLAGGVAVGSSSDLVIQPWGALLIGVVAGALSVIGYVYVQPCLARCCGLDDTCGVHNLHGMPGIVGAIGGAISAAMATSDIVYGGAISDVFPGRACREGKKHGIDVNGTDLCYTASTQAGYQVAALGVTLVISIIGGLLTGILVNAPCLRSPQGQEPGKCGPCSKFGQGSDEKIWYDDSYYWEVPEADAHEKNWGDAHDHETIALDDATKK